MIRDNVGLACIRPQNSHPTGIVGLLWRHKFKVIATFLGVTLAALVFLVTAEREYRSEAKIFVRSGGQVLNLPSANAENIAVGDVQQREVNAVAELLQSRRLAEMVVDKFGVETILGDSVQESDLSSVGEWIASGKAFLSNLNDYNLNPLQSFSDRDEAIVTFHASLNVLPKKTSNVISISYDFMDPDVAQKILAFLLEKAKEEHFQIHLTPGSQAFFVNQANRLRITLSDLELRLRDFKNETGLASLEIQRASILGLIGTLEQDRIQTLTQLDSVESEVQSRRQQLLEIPNEIVSQRATDQPNSIGQLLRSKVYDLEATEQEQASKLASNHPILLSTRERLSEAKKLLKDEKQPVGITTGVNPNYQAFDLAIRDREATSDGLATRVKSLSDKLQSARTEVQRLNAAEVDLSELQREIELVQANYRTYSENLEKSRIHEELERTKISGLTLLQPPTNSPTPVRPKPLITMILAVIAASAASCALALLAEYQKSGDRSTVISVPSREDISNRPSELPVAMPEPSKVILQRVQRKTSLPR